MEAAPLDPIAIRSGRPRLPLAVRPMLPSDRGAFSAFLRAISQEDLALRFGRPVAVDAPCVERFLFGPADETCSVVGAFGRGGEILGSANLCLGEAGVGEVALIVTPSARLRSVGRTLIEALVVAASGRGLRRLEANISPCNSEALALAARCKFRIFDRRTWDGRFSLDI